MAQASSDWILILDADERVTEELRGEVRTCLEQWKPGAPVAYRIPRRNFFYGAWVQRAGVYPDYQVRLFRRGVAQYNDVAVHENLLVEGAIGTLAGHLDHYTERRIQDHFKKFGLYTTLAAQEKAKKVRTVRWIDLTFRPLVVFGKTYFVKQGFRDGVQGLIVCVFASMYTFVKYAKLWDATELSRYSSSSSSYFSSAFMELTIFSRRVTPLPGAISEMKLTAAIHPAMSS